MKNKWYLKFQYLQTFKRYLKFQCLPTFGINTLNLKSKVFEFSIP